MASAKRNSTERTTYYSGSNFYVRPTYVVSIPQYVHTGSNNSRRHSNSLANLENNDAKGNISKKAESKIKNAVNWLVSSAKYKRVYDKKTGKNFFFKINFITLTIPLQEEIPSDKFVKEKIFHSWISYARKYFGLRNYIWRAESQANGMIHFHVTSDTFLHHAKIRKSWNRILGKEGMLEGFKAKFGHDNPNSTDVHSVKNVQNLAGYLAKYFCKDDKERRKISGRLWGCNYELSHEKKCTVYADPDESAIEHKALFKKEIEWKPILSKPDSLGRQNTLGELFFVREKKWKILEGRLVHHAYNTRRFEIRHNVAHLPPEYFTIN